MDPYHRIPEKFEEFTQKYHSEIEKTSTREVGTILLLANLLMAALRLQKKKFRI